MNNISFIFPIYNEEKRVKYILDFISWVKKNKITKYEIILVSNGSNDNTVPLLKSYAKKIKQLKVYDLKKASRGGAIKIGIKKSNYDINAICAIDNAWDLNFYLQSFKVISNTNFSIVFGPKTHIYSKIKRPLIRKLISIICTLYLKLLFGDKIDQDTQCIKLFDKKKIKITNFLSNRNLFFDAEFFLMIRKFKVNYLSIPVKVKDNKKMISFKMMLMFMIDALTFRFSKNYNRKIY